jgi:hypothetical protein
MSCRFYRVSGARYRTGFSTSVAGSRNGSVSPQRAGLPPSWYDPTRPTESVCSERVWRMASEATPERRRRKFRPETLRHTNGRLRETKVVSRAGSGEW